MLKVYAYENYEGDKGIIITKSKDMAENIFYKKYPNREIVTVESGDYYSSEINGAYLFQVGEVEEDKLYDTFPW